ncbi:MAG: outer membrane porin, OprD family, partial [Campylobacterales bacterium]|nr:outer membrane porin, OprD family [Campylobacterales bacterium]
MKKIVAISVITSATLFANSFEMFEKGEVNGEIRTGYINLDTKNSGSNSAFALGGHLKYETTSIYGVSFGAGAYTSQGLGLNEDDKNPDFFDTDGKSFTILGESYINYKFDKWSVKAGRQIVDTPFANTDDIRMAPNLFEGVVASFEPIENLVIIGAY